MCCSTQGGTTAHSQRGTLDRRVTPPRAVTGRAPASPQRGNSPPPTGITAQQAYTQGLDCCCCCCCSCQPYAPPSLAPSQPTCSKLGGPHTPLCMRACAAGPQGETAVHSQRGTLDRRITPPRAVTGRVPASPLRQTQPPTHRNHSTASIHTGPGLLLLLLLLLLLPALRPSLPSTLPTNLLQTRRPPHTLVHACLCCWAPG
jgi:hypothetical protein